MSPHPDFLGSGQEHRASESICPQLALITDVGNLRVSRMTGSIFVRGIRKVARFHKDSYKLTGFSWGRRDGIALGKENEQMQSLSIPRVFEDKSSG